MQKSTTIIGVLEMLEDGFSYNDIRTRYSIGNSTITDIKKKFLSNFILWHQKWLNKCSIQTHILERKLRYRILRKSIKSLQIKIPRQICILFGLIIRNYIQMAINTRNLNITLNNGLMKIIWKAILEWQSTEFLVKLCI